MPLGLLAFWAGMLIAARRYPAEYDWRYVTISSLVYPERNPGGFLWARAGIALCGFAGLYWTSRLVRSARHGGPGQTPSGVRVLGFGCLCMSGCALLPEWLIRVPKAHDLLALAAFLGICIGTVRVTLAAVAGAPRIRDPGSRARRIGALLLASAALSPVVLAALAQTYVSHALPGLPWVSLVWRARGVPAYLSFAFWEWVTCAVLSVYLAALSLAIRTRA